MKNFICLCLVFNIYISTYATPILYNSTINIEGRVLNKSTGEIMEYVSLALYDAMDSTLITGNISNQNGEFIIEGISIGSYFLTASFIGFEDYTINKIELDGSIPIFVVADITLEENINELDEVVVTGKKQEVNIRLDKSVINVSKNISAAGGTAVDALKVSPSVTTDQEGNILLRGSSSYKVLINVRPTAMKSNEALKQVPAVTIDRIEIVTNPSARFDGEGTAGLINIITKKGKKPGINSPINISAGTGSKYSEDASVYYMSDKLSSISWSTKKGNLTHRAMKYY